MQPSAQLILRAQSYESGASVFSVKSKRINNRQNFLVVSSLNSILLRMFKKLYRLAENYI